MSKISLVEAAQQALEALEFWCPATGHALNKRAEAVVALRAVLAEPVLEPVAWMDIDENGNRLSVRLWSDGNREEVPLYTAPPQRKPFDEHFEVNFCARCGKRTRDVHSCTPPPKL